MLGGREGGQERGGGGGIAVRCLIQLLNLPQHLSHRSHEHVNLRRRRRRRLSCLNQSPPSSSVFFVVFFDFFDSSTSNECDSNLSIVVVHRRCCRPREVDRFPIETVFYWYKWLRQRNSPLLINCRIH